MHRQFGSRCQLIYCVAHRLAEIVQLLSVHSPVEGPTDIGAEQSDLDVIRFVDHRVLLCVSPENLPAYEERTSRTLIMVRRMVTVPKTALAGVMLEISFARFRASMAILSEERTASRPFGRWDLVAIVGTRDSWEKAVGAQAGRKSPDPAVSTRPPRRSSVTTPAKTESTGCFTVAGVVVLVHH